MTPGQRQTLQTYAERMGKSWSDVKRDYSGLSQTDKGRIIVEMNRVELIFKAKLDKAQARRDRLMALFAPARWVARRVGGAWGRVLRFIRK